MQSLARVSNLEKLWETPKSLAPSRTRKLNCHFSFYSRLSRFLEKILFLFSTYEILKSKSRSLLDLWDFEGKNLVLFSIYEILKHKSRSLLELWDSERLVLKFYLFNFINSIFLFKRLSLLNVKNFLEIYFSSWNWGDEHTCEKRGIWGYSTRQFFGCNWIFRQFFWIFRQI